MKTVRIHTNGYIPLLKTSGPIFSKIKISDQIYDQLIKQNIVVEVVETKIDKPTKPLPVHVSKEDVSMTPKNPLMSKEEIKELVEKKEELDLELGIEIKEEEKLELEKKEEVKLEEEKNEEKPKKETELADGVITVKKSTRGRKKR